MKKIIFENAVFWDALSCESESELQISNTFRCGVKKYRFSKYTMIGALANYISTPNQKFQPMNANFGILPELEGKKIRDKKERYLRLTERSLENLEVK